MGLMVLGGIAATRGDTAVAEPAPAATTQAAKPTTAAPTPDPTEDTVDKASPDYRQGLIDGITDADKGSAKANVDSKSASYKAAYVEGYDGEVQVKKALDAANKAVEAQKAADAEKKAEKASEDAAKKAEADEKAKPSMTKSQEQAIGSAEDYLEYSAFSRKGLIQQLSSDAGEGFSKSDAKFAVDHIKVDWNEQAAKSAESYLEYSNFSRKGLIQQLESEAGEGFTHAQAVYGVNKSGL